MSDRVKIVRGLNFAYPWSERDEYFLPRTVRILVGVSALIVVLLVALPFYLQSLARVEQRARFLLTQDVSLLRAEADKADPVLAMQARLDSIRTELQVRLDLYAKIAATDYPADRLLLHLGEILPDGVLLTAIDVAAPASATGGRPGLQGASADVPPEAKDLFTLILEGTTSSAEAIQNLRRILENSPLFYAPRDNVNVIPGTLRDFRFTINAYLPGSGGRLTGGP